MIFLPHTQVNLWGWKITNRKESSRGLTRVGVLEGRAGSGGHEDGVSLAVLVPARDHVSPGRGVQEVRRHPT